MNIIRIKALSTQITRYLLCGIWFSQTCSQMFFSQNTIPLLNRRSCTNLITGSFYNTIDKGDRLILRKYIFSAVSLITLNNLNRNIVKIIIQNVYDIYHSLAVILADIFTVQFSLEIAPFLFIINNVTNMSIFLVNDDVLLITVFSFTEMAFETMNIYALELTNTCFLYNTSKSLCFVFFTHSIYMFSADITHSFHCVHVLFLCSFIKKCIGFANIDQLIQNI